MIAIAAGKASTECTPFSRSAPYRRGGRGHGGWYGDPEGHSRASREGWDERGGSRTRSRYDDDDDYRSSRSRSRYRDDD